MDKLCLLGLLIFICGNVNGELNYTAAESRFHGLAMLTSMDMSEIVKLEKINATECDKDHSETKLSDSLKEKLRAISDKYKGKMVSDFPSIYDEFCDSQVQNVVLNYFNTVSSIYSKCIKNPINSKLFKIGEEHWHHSIEFACQDHKQCLIDAVSSEDIPVEYSFYTHQKSEIVDKCFHKIYKTISPDSSDEVLHSKFDEIRSCSTSLLKEANPAVGDIYGKWSEFNHHQHHHQHHHHHHHD